MIGDVLHLQTYVVNLVCFACGESEVIRAETLPGQNDHAAGLLIRSTYARGWRLDLRSAPGGLAICPRHEPRHRFPGPQEVW